MQGRVRLVATYPPKLATASRRGSTPWEGSPSRWSAGGRRLTSDWSTLRASPRARAAVGETQDRASRTGAGTRSSVHSLRVSGAYLRSRPGDADPPGRGERRGTARSRMASSPRSFRAFAPVGARRSPGAECGRCEIQELRGLRERDLEIRVARTPEATKVFCAVPIDL